MSPTRMRGEGAEGTACVRPMRPEDRCRTLRVSQESRTSRQSLAPVPKIPSPWIRPLMRPFLELMLP
jgi:hypothetical protein